MQRYVKEKEINMYLFWGGKKKSNNNNSDEDSGNDEDSGLVTIYMLQYIFPILVPMKTSLLLEETRSTSRGKRPVRPEENGAVPLMVLV